jgi:hypothetical protein
MDLMDSVEPMEPIEGNEASTARYFIDERWFDRVNKSYRAMAQARMCESCKEKVGTETQERAPSVDPRTGRVVFEVRSVLFGQNPVAAIRSCCSKRRDYITPETPVAEALFRVFLASGNQPMELELIREELSNYVSMSDRPHNYAPELLERIMRTDRYYGLRRFTIASD